MSNAKTIREDIARIRLQLDVTGEGELTGARRQVARDKMDGLYRELLPHIEHEDLSVRVAPQLAREEPNRRRIEYIRDMLEATGEEAVTDPVEREALLAEQQACYAQRGA